MIFRGKLNFEQYGEQLDYYKIGEPMGDGEYRCHVVKKATKLSHKMWKQWSNIQLQSRTRIRWFAS